MFAFSDESLTQFANSILKFLGDFSWEYTEFKINLGKGMNIFM